MQKKVVVYSYSTTKLCSPCFVFLNARDFSHDVALAAPS
jgi:hypothetical protein